MNARANAFETVCAVLFGGAVACGIALWLFVSIGLLWGPSWFLPFARMFDNLTR